MGLGMASRKCIGGIILRRLTCGRSRWKWVYRRVDRFKSNELKKYDLMLVLLLLLVGLRRHPQEP